MKPIPTLLTLKEMPNVLKLPEHYLRSLCWNNEIPYRKAGNRYILNLEKTIDYFK